MSLPAHGRGLSPTRWQFTIGSLMRDIVLLGLALPGMKSNASPPLVMFTAFAVAYFMVKILFAITPPLSSFLLYSEPPPPEVDPDRETIDVEFANELLREGRLRLKAGDYPRSFAVARELHSGYPNSPATLDLLSTTLLAMNEATEAREILKTIVTDEPGNPREMALKWNNLAWADVLIGEISLRDEADKYSELAFQARGDDPAVEGTRGTVLVWIGRYQEGVDLLRSSYEAHSHPKNRAFNACALAMGTAALGRRAEAAAYLDEALALSPACPLIPRAVEAVGRILPARHPDD